MRSLRLLSALATLLLPLTLNADEVEICQVEFEGKRPAEDIYQKIEKTEIEDDYQSDRSQCTPPQDLQSSGPLVCESIYRTYQKLKPFIKQEKGAEDHGRLVAAQREEKKNWYDKEGPQDYRDDYLPDGHLPRDEAWQRYTADSMRTLDITEQNQQQWDRFVGCLEARRVVTDQRYTQMCQANCPAVVQEPGPCGCNGQGFARQDFEVYSYYLPVYTFILGKDGHRFVDPEMFQPAIQQREDLTLENIKQHHDRHIDSDILPQLDEKGIDSGKFERPDWYDPGKRFFLESGLHDDSAPMAYSLSVGGIRTNWVARLSDSRLTGTQHHGYARNDLCFAWAAPEETARRRVLTNYMEAENVLNSIMLFPEFTAMIDREKYDMVHHFSSDQPNFFAAAAEVSADPSQSLNQIAKVPRWRNWMWPGSTEGRVGGWTGDECGSGFDDLKLLGVQSDDEEINSHDAIYWSFEISPFTNVQWWHNPLFAAIGNVGRAAQVLGSPHQALAHVNIDDQEQIRRHLQFTYYQARYSRPRVSYLNTRSSASNDQYECCRCPNGQCCGRHLIGLDKFQVVFPPVAPNRGNECFTLNSVPRDNDDANWPKHLVTFFQQYGLIHITMWDYRVACACEVCGLVQGCLTLNRGDFAEDLPEGSEPFPNGVPQSIRAIQPYLRGMAENRGAFGNPPLLECERHIEIDLQGQTNGGTPGAIQAEDSDYCQNGGEN